MIIPGKQRQIMKTKESQKNWRSLGGFFLCFASIFANGEYPKLHEYSTALCAFFVSIGVLMLATNILLKDFLLGIIILIATYLIPISYFLRNRSTGAYWEFILFAGITTWNIALSIPLIVK